MPSGACRRWRGWDVARRSVLQTVRQRTDVEVPSRVVKWGMDTANPPRPPVPDMERDSPAGDEHTAVDLTREPPRTPDNAAVDSNNSPRLPHDRDEAVGMTNGRPDVRIRQGHDDVARGVQDTTRGAEADQTYRRLKREDDRHSRKRNR